MFVKRSTRSWRTHTHTNQCVLSHPLTILPIIHTERRIYAYLWGRTIPRPGQYSDQTTSHWTSGASSEIHGRSALGDRKRARHFYHGQCQNWRRQCQSTSFLWNVPIGVDGTRCLLRPQWCVSAELRIVKGRKEGRRIKAGRSFSFWHVKSSPILSNPSVFRFF